MVHIITCPKHGKELVFYKETATHSLFKCPNPDCDYIGENGAVRSDLPERYIQLQEELAGTEQDLDGIYGWLGDRVIEYGKFKDGDVIIERIGDVIEKRLERIEKNEISGNILSLRDYIKGLQEELRQYQWISVKKSLPKMKRVDAGISDDEKSFHSDWVRITDGEKVVDAYYYDLTQRKEKSNYTTGKGWYCHNIRKADITHFQYVILPKKEIILPKEEIILPKEE